MVPDVSPDNGLYLVDIIPPFRAKSMKTGHILTVLLVAFLIFSAESQTILFPSVSEKPTVCQPHTFTFSVFQNSANPLPATNVAVYLPCGMTYLPGSVVGLTEQDLGTPQVPVFMTESIPAGSTKEVTLEVDIPCESLHACLDSGKLFFLTVRIGEGADTLVFPSDPFNLETPHLVITKVDDQIMMGHQGQVLERKVHVRNTRLGKLSTFTYFNFYGEGVNIEVNQGSDIGGVPGEVRRLFSGPDFALSGNGDAYLDFNEEVIITERITVDACPEDKDKVFSEILVRWGCAADFCQSVSQQTLIRVSSAGTGGAVHLLEAELYAPACRTNTSTRQKLVLKDTSATQPMVNVRLTLWENGLFRKFSTENYSATLNGVPVSHQFGPLDTNSCGQTGAASDTLFIPLIQPGDELMIEWDAYDCKDIPCLPGEIVLRWWITYESPCNVASDYYQNDAGQFNFPVPRLATIVSTPLYDGSVLTGGEAILTRLQIYSGNLLDEGTYLKIQLDLPCGFSFQDTTFQIFNQNPIAKSVFPTNSTTRYELTYATPFPDSLAFLDMSLLYTCDTLCSNISCADSLITSCQTNCPVATDFASILIITGLGGDADCPIATMDNHCNSLLFQTNCRKGVCLDTLFGYFDFNMALERISLGQPDNDQNFKPDPGGTLNPQLIRLDRMIAGDTILLQHRGVIRVEMKDTVFERLSIRHEFSLEDVFQIKESEALQELAKLSDPQTGFVALNAQIRIHPHNSPLVWTATVPIVFDSLSQRNLIVADLAAIRHTHPSFPSDYRYSDMDSIEILAWYRLDHNPHAYPTFFNHIITVGFNAKAFLSSGPAFRARESSACQCRKANVEVGNVRFEIGRDDRVFPLCAATIKDYGMFIHFSTLPNFFPYEYKPPIDSFLQLGITARDFTITNVRITSIRVNGITTNLNQSVPVPDLIQNEYQLKPDPFLRNHWEESNVIFFRFDLHKDLCELLPSDSDYPVAQAVLKTFRMRPFGLTEQKPTQLILNWEYTQPEMEITLCDQTFYDDRMSWMVQLTNCGKITPFLREIDRLWLHVESSGKSIDSLQIKRYPQGDLLTENGDWFDFGPLGVCDTQFVVIEALNKSCHREELTISTGWSCDEEDPLSAPCVKRTITCQFFTPPGVLESQVDTDTLVAPLCTPMPLSHSLYLNADLGAAFATGVTATLPGGLTYIPGTAALSWPGNTGLFFPINDPAILPGGQLYWSLADWLMPPSGSLPGTLSHPFHLAELQFQTLTDCDFVSGSRIIYTFSGQQVCGSAANTLVRISGPYQLEGVFPPHELSLGVSWHTPSACDDFIEVTIDLVSGNVNTSDEQLVVDLPAGYVYEPGSTVTNLGQMEPIVNYQQLVWHLEPGLPATQIAFRLLLEPGAGCKPVIIPVYSTAEVQAFCTGSGSSCPVKVLTASRYLTVHLDRPTFAIASVDAIWDQGSVIVKGVIAQTGGTAPGSGMAGLYLDLDGNGQLSPGDSSLYSQPFAFQNAEDLSVLFPHLNLAPEDWCRLMVVIRAEESCACQTVTQSISKPIVFPDYHASTTCWNDTLSLGRPSVDGVQYLWTGNHISCDTCATTLFTAYHTADTVLTESLLLTEVYPDGCILTFEYLITVLPKPHLLNPDESVCAGDTLLLIAAGGFMYAWEGPQILASGDGFLTAIPSMPSTYYVTITDMAGCLTTDSAMVEVISFPSAPAGQDKTYCHQFEAFLEAQEWPGYTYYWVNANNQLSDPSHPNPQILVPISYSYILEMAKGHCQIRDTVDIRFDPPESIAGLPDTLHACLGDTVRFSLPEAWVYEWVPGYTWLCLNQNCSEVQIPVSQYWEFLVTATDSNGCSVSQSVVIIPETEEAVNIYQTRICEGNFIVISGDTVSLPGMYCDTVVVGSGCLYISCVQLEYSPPVITAWVDSFCSGGYYLFQVDTLYTPGTFLDTIVLTDGCIEIISLDLQIIPPDTMLVTDTICAGGIYEFHGSLITEEGIHCVTLVPPDQDCEEIHCLYLVWDDPPVTHLTDTLCPGAFVVFHNDTLSIPGIYCDTFTDMTGCDSVVCLTLVADSLPVIFANWTDTILCAGQLILAQPVLSPPWATFAWEDNYPELERLLTAPGNYQLTATNSCGETGISFALVEPEPPSVALGPDTILCAGSVIVLEPQAVGTGTEGFWTDGFEEWTRPVDTPGLYVFVVTDLCDRTAADSLVVALVQCDPCKVDIPNLFTPNGDGVNDVFRLVTSCPLENPRMRIFDRWGTVVYDGHAVNPGWNGVFRQTPQPMEVYAYVIEYNDPLEGPKILRGDVTLLR